MVLARCDTLPPLDLFCVFLQALGIAPAWLLNILSGDQLSVMSCQDVQQPPTGCLEAGVGVIVNQGSDWNADSCCDAVQSTLMREIAAGKVDGFPPKEELRTVYVEHDIDAEASDVSVAQYVLQDPTLEGEVDEKKVAEALGDVGFTPAMQADRVAALSGGWKMKLALGEPFPSF